MQNRAQLKESKCVKDMLKCANEKRRPRVLLVHCLVFLEQMNMQDGDRMSEVPRGGQPYGVGFL